MSILCLTVKNTITCKYSIILTLCSVAMLPLAFAPPPPIKKSGSASGKT